MDSIEVLRQTEPHPESPLPWRVNGRFLEDSNGEDVGGIGYREDAAHIAAAVNAAPVLLAEIDRLRALLVTSERLRIEEATAVLCAIRPSAKQELSSGASANLRGVTLTEDFLPVAERILAENETLRAQLAAAQKGE